MRRIAILLTVLLATGSIGLVGCRVAGKSFQMDSDSQTPSFGLHLVPTMKKKKPKEIRPATHEQGNEQEVAESQAVKQASGSKYSFSRWKKWLNPLASSPKHIPLPRTDLAEDDDDEKSEQDKDRGSLDDF